MAFVPGFAARIQPPYSVEQSITWKSPCHDVPRFIVLSNHPGLLSISHNHQFLDTAVVAWHKRWKHCRSTGDLKFHVVSAGIAIQFLSCAEKITYQRRLAEIFATWRCEKAVSTVPEMAFPGVDEHWCLIWHVVEQRYRARKHHFVRRLCLRHNVLAGWNNPENFSNMPAGRGGLLLVLPPWWDRYECSYLFLVLAPLLFSYYGGLILRSGFHDIWRMNSMVISKLTVLAGVQFPLYAAERATQDYFVGSLRFDHARRGISLWLPSLLLNILSHFVFYNVA